MNSERLKIAGKEILINLNKTIIDIWNSEQIEQGWKTAVAIYNKGDSTKVENYQSISLLDATYKRCSH